MSTPLQQALVNAGITELTFNATAAGITETIKVEDIPDASLIRVLQYGKRLFNDTINRSKEGDKPVKDIASDWFFGLMEGTLGEGGAQRGNPLETAMREVLVQLLRRKGMKAKAAQDAAKDMDATLLKLAKGDAEAMRKAKAQIQTHAEKLLSMRATPEIDIG